MPIHLVEKKISANRKRIDAVIKQSKLFGKTRFLKVRVLGYEPLPEEEDELEELFEKIMQQEKNWKDCKKSCSVHLSEENATAFILDKDYKIKSNENID